LRQSSYIDFNDRFARSTGDDAVARYKKQTAAAKAKKAPTKKQDEYYDSMEYGDEFNDDEEQDYKREKNLKDDDEIDEEEEVEEDGEEEGEDDEGQEDEEEEDESESEELAPIAPKELPKRASRGLRMNALVGKALEEDQQFWSSGVFLKKAGDELGEDSDADDDYDMKEESASAAKDSFDSDFD
jgi:hypothetical protein